MAARRAGAATAADAASWNPDALSGKQRETTNLVMARLFGLGLQVSIGYRSPDRILLGVFRSDYTFQRFRAENPTLKSSRCTSIWVGIQPRLADLFSKLGNLELEAEEQGGLVIGEAPSGEPEVIPINSENFVAK